MATAVAEAASAAIASARCGCAAATAVAQASAIQRNIATASVTGEFARLTCVVEGEKGVRWWHGRWCGGGKRG